MPSTPSRDWNILVTRRIVPSGLDLLRSQAGHVEVFDEEFPMDHSRFIAPAHDPPGRAKSADHPARGTLCQ